MLRFILLFCGLWCVNALPNAGNMKEGSQVDLPENWDQTKDTQSLFENKNDKNDLEPYPLALSDEANQDILRDSAESAKQSGEFDGLVMRSELYGEPPSFGSGAYDVRRKRGSGTKVASGATKIVTKASGKKNLRHILEPNRSKRDSSGLSAADVRALLAMWEAQERRKQQELNRLAERYYSRNSDDDNQVDIDDNGEMWYNEAPSYFSEQNRYAHVFPEKQYYGERPKRYMVARKRTEPQVQYRPREDLYTLAELLHAGPQRNEVPAYRRHVM